jgi:hypothetical protein
MTKKRTDQYDEHDVGPESDSPHAKSDNSLVRTMATLWRKKVELRRLPRGGITMVPKPGDPKHKPGTKPVKFQCACDPPYIIRYSNKARDLDASCNVCGAKFAVVDEAEGSEQLQELPKRVSKKHVQAIEPKAHEALAKQRQRRRKHEDFAFDLKGSLAGTADAMRKVEAERRPNDDLEDQDPPVPLTKEWEEEERQCKADEKEFSKPWYHHIDFDLVYQFATKVLEHLATADVDAANQGDDLIADMTEFDEKQGSPLGHHRWVPSKLTATDWGQLCRYIYKHEPGFKAKVATATKARAKDLKERRHRGVGPTPQKRPRKQDQTKTKARKRSKLPV